MCAKSLIAVQVCDIKVILDARTLAVLDAACKTVAEAMNR